MNNTRDLVSYEKNYQTLPFEPILVQYRRKAVIENIQKYKHENILEVGCGNEPLFNYFKDFSSMTVVEPTEQFYNNACALKGDNEQITILNNLFENELQTLKQTSFDFIIVSCLLHELSDYAEFLNCLNQVANPSTVIHINVPNANSFHRMLAVKSKIIEDQFAISGTQLTMQQKSVFSAATLKKEVEKYNFKVLEQGSYFIKPFTHAQMQALVDQNIINEKVLEGLFQMSELLPEWGAEIFVNLQKN